MFDRAYCKINSPQNLSKEKLLVQRYGKLKLQQSLFLYSVFINLKALFNF